MKKINQWKFKTKTIAYVKSTTFKTKTSYIKVSFISILLGLLCGIIFLYCFGMNGFGFIFSSIIKPFTSPVYPEETVILLAVFILLGLGLALGFRIKLFNMGGSGQTIGGLLITYIFLSAITGGSDFSNLADGYGIVFFLIFIISGAIVSSLTGILKVVFNIHEVATSIVINWILWYLLKYFLFVKFQTQMNSPNLPEVFGSYLWVFAIAVALISVVTVFVVCETTTTGYKYKVVGMQSTAAKYAGIKINTFIIGVTALQGIFISAAGFFYYFGLMGSLDVRADILPLLGFDGIPIALVAFNNFIGIILIAILWAILKDGIQLTMSSPGYMGMPAETADLLFGFMIYFSTMYLVLSKIDLKHYFELMMLKMKSPKIKAELIELKAKIKEAKIEKRSIKNDKELLGIKNLIEKSEKSSDNYIQLKENYQEVLRFKTNKINFKIKDFKTELKNFKTTKINEYRTNSIKGLKTIYVSKYNELTFPIMEGVAILESKKLNIKNDQNKNKEEIKEALTDNYQVIIQVINSHQKTINKLNSQFKNIKKQSNAHLKQLKEETNKKIKEINETVNDKAEQKKLIDEVKEELFQKQMEVAKIYGSDI